MVSAAPRTPEVILIFSRPAYFAVSVPHFDRAVCEHPCPRNFHSPSTRSRFNVLVSQRSRGMEFRLTMLHPRRLIAAVFHTVHD